MPLVLSPLLLCTLNKSFVHRTFVPCTLYCPSYIILTLNNQQHEKAFSSSAALGSK